MVLDPKVKRNVLARDKPKVVSDFESDLAIEWINKLETLYGKQLFDLNVTSIETGGRFSTL